MSSVEIRPSNEGGYQVLVDGHDVSKLLTPDGVDVIFDMGRPRVRLTLRPNVVDLTLPDAVVRTVADVTERQR